MEAYLHIHPSRAQIMIMDYKNTLKKKIKIFSKVTLELFESDLIGYLIIHTNDPRPN